MINEFYRKVILSTVKYCISSDKGGIVHHFVEAVAEVATNVT